MSRCVLERLDGGERAVVRAIQRRAVHLAVVGGPLLLLCRPDVPLAPNAFAVDVEPDAALEHQGFRVGHVVSFSGGAPSGHDADWRIALETAVLWEPRPAVAPITPRDLAHRMRGTRAVVVAEGAGESLLPLLWALERGVHRLGSAFAGMAGRAARRLSDAAIREDASAVARAAAGLAGLGPGLTPSGDDLLAGFVAAWTLVGDALAVDHAARARVTGAVLAGAARGASPLGRIWLEHACRGELLEPMTRFIATLLAPAARGLDAAVRDALAIGSSSGTDWMVGFLLGSTAMLEATTAARSW
jgi:uncharacterized protein DUF2877